MMSKKYNTLLMRMKKVKDHVENFGYWKKTFLFFPKRVEGKIRWLTFVWKKNIVNVEIKPVTKTKIFYRGKAKYCIDMPTEDVLEFENGQCKEYYESLIKKLEYWGKK